LLNGQGTARKYHVGMKIIGLSCEDAQDKDDRGQRKGATDYPDLPGKWLLCATMYYITGLD